MVAMTALNATARRPVSNAGRKAPDLRLVLGILLVAGSVAGVYGIVAAADRRVVVYAAASALTPGEHIDADDLVQRSVALDGVDRLYLTAGRIPPGGLVVTQPVAKGALLPTSAVGSAAGVRSTSLVLRLATQVSGAVVPGATIDIWAASDPDAVAAAASPVTSADDPTAPADPSASVDLTGPAVIVPGATVVKVVEETGGFSASASGSSVEVLVPRDRVARLLQAIAQKASLAVVPAGIPISESAGAGGS